MPKLSNTERVAREQAHNDTRRVRQRPSRAKPGAKRMRLELVDGRWVKIMEKVGK